MAELTVESGPLRGQTVILSESDQLLIGRGQDCTLRLETPGIADRHLVIKALKNGGFGVKKLEASFVLNGQVAEAARLSDGDLLEVGDTRLRFGPVRDEWTRKNGTDAEISIEGYRLLEVLGKGGHGTVYRAEQLSLHREVALKVLKKEMTANPEFIGRFVAEARAAARLSHPNVVQVFDVGHDGDTYHLSMEIMEHGSLESRLKRDKRIPIEECLQFMIEAARGLQYAESMRMVHRDIKPDNLMVDSHGTIKIADLGLALSDEDGQGKIVGTPHFMSPEQVLGRPLDHRADLYSLGCTFFRLVTGRTLFPKRTTKEILTAQVKSTPDSADEINDEVPARVAEIIDQLVEKDPDDRYQSAGDLIDDLIEVLHPPAKKGRWIALIAVIVLGAGYAIYWGATRQDRIIEVKGDGNDAETALVKKQLHEKAADLALLTIEQNREGLDKTDLADRLDAFGKNGEYADTPAAARAIASAKKIRAEEALRVENERQRSAAITAADEKLRKRLQKWIDDERFEEAAAGLRPDDIAADILREPKLQETLKDMRAALVAKADTKLDAWRGSVEKSRVAKDPDSMETAIASIAAILDEKGSSAWPEAAFADRPAVAVYVRNVRKDIATLREELASSRESSAWANLRRSALHTGGVLHKVAQFDVGGAVVAARKVRDEVAAFQAVSLGTNLLETVRAADAYYKDFLTAVKSGTLTVSVDVAGTVTDVKILAFAVLGDEAGLKIEIPGARGSTTRVLPLSELHGARLLEVFSNVEGAGRGPGGAAASQANRLAFLSLHVLWTHLDAAKKYMSKLDPQVPDSGTGEDRYRVGVAEINAILKQMSDVNASWSKFVASELRAARELSRGLLAFSQKRYTSCHGYLENLKKRYGTSLAALKVQ